MKTFLLTKFRVILSLVFLLSFLTSFSQNNVGIGTTTPRGKALLDLNSNNLGLLLPRVDRSLVTPGLATADNGLLVYDTTVGNQGVWYWDGTIWLQVGTGVSGWGLTGNSGTNASNYLGTGDGQPLRMRTNNIERMQIAANGNIGIGTGTPIETIDLNGRMWIRPTSGGGLPVSAGQGMRLSFNPADSLAIISSFDYAAGTPRNMALQYNGGFLGIGSTNKPIETVDITGRLWIRSDFGGGLPTSAGAGLRLGFDPTNQVGAIFGFDYATSVPRNIVFQVPGGNVGIGLNVPSERLDVAGNIRFSGALMPNNQPGTIGQVLTSQGTGVPPIWSSSIAGIAPANLLIYWKF